MYFRRNPSDRVSAWWLLPCWVFVSWPLTASPCPLKTFVHFVLPAIFPIPAHPFSLGVKITFSSVGNNLSEVGIFYSISLSTLLFIHYNLCSLWLFDFCLPEGVVLKWSPFPFSFRARTLCLCDSTAPSRPLAHSILGGEREIVGGGRQRHHSLTALFSWIFP